MVRALQAEDPPTIGPYRLVGQLGRGGMGRVFLGISAGGRPVAVKAIRAELAADPEFRRRFTQEVAAARRVNGLFTAMVVDADVDGPLAWLATAYVQGPSLTEAVTDHGPLPAESLLTLAAGLAESLNAIHAAGVVHRDLKPSNVLLSGDGPRVIDFGISRAVESTSVTQAGLVIGSPGFMSPEQAEGLDVGPPSDIFSLGAVLAYAAAGQGPFGTGTTAAMLYRIVHGEPHLEQVPPDVRPLVERCLAKNPLQRPTAGGLLAEVGALQPSGDWLPESIVRAMSGGPATAKGSAAAATGGVNSAAFEATLASRPGQAPSSESQLLAPRASPAPMTATPGRVPPTPAGAYPVSPPPPADGYPVPLPPLSAPPIARRPRRRRRAPVLAWVFGGAIVVGAGIGIVLTAVTGHHPKTPLQSRPAALTTAPTSGSSVRGVAASRAASPSATHGVSLSASPSSIASTSASARSSPSASVHTSKSPSATPSQSPTPSQSSSPSPSPTPSTSSSPTPSPTPSPSTSATSSPTTSASTVASTSPSSSAST